jgi:hypothetical protein
MKVILNLLIFLMCFITPAAIYGEALPQPNDDIPVINQRPARSQSYINSDTNHKRNESDKRHSDNTKYNNYTQNYSRHYAPPAPHSRYNRHGAHFVVAHRYYRPRTYYSQTYYVEPVVHTSNACTTCSDNNVYTNYESAGRFGLGLIGILYKYSEYGNINNGIAGGVGFYLKYRPIRYFSLEFTNQYLYGNLKYSNSLEQEYIKIPFTLGARFHFFDYGNLDIYSAIAGSISVWRYIEDYDYWREQYNYLNESGVQYGGQIGLGASIILSSLEFGIDLRYTIESVPNYIPGYYSDKDDNEVVHGMLLSLGVGFSL